MPNLQEDKIREEWKTIFRYSYSEEFTTHKQIADWWFKKFRQLQEEEIYREVAARLETICNKSKTEKGFARAVGNFIADLRIRSKDN